MLLSLSFFLILRASIACVTYELSTCHGQHQIPLTEFTAWFLTQSVPTIISSFKRLFCALLCFFINSIQKFNVNDYTALITNI